MRNGNTPVICFLSSAVCPPHHFTAKRVKENMIKAFYYFDTVICPADSELGGFFARFTSAEVKRAKKPPNSLSAGQITVSK